MLPAFVAGCLLLAERRPRRVTLAALGVVHLALLALVAAARRPDPADAAARLDRDLGQVVLEGRDRLARTGRADLDGLALAYARRARGRRRSSPATTAWPARSRSTARLRAYPARLRAPLVPVLAPGEDAAAGCPAGRLRARRRAPALRASDRAGRRRQPLARRQRGARPADRLVPAARSARAALAVAVRDRAAARRQVAHAACATSATARVRAAPSRRPRARCRRTGAAAAARAAARCRRRR